MKREPRSAGTNPSTVNPAINVPTNQSMSALRTNAKSPKVTLIDGFERDRGAARAVADAAVLVHQPVRLQAQQLIYIINHAYGSNFAVGAADTGKNMDFTDWMYAR